MTSEYLDMLIIKDNTVTLNTICYATTNKDTQMAMVVSANCVMGEARILVEIELSNQATEIGVRRIP